MRDGLSLDTLRQFAERIKAEQDLAEFHLYITRRGDIRLNSIVANIKKQGRGSAAMRALVRLADEHERRIVLTTADKDIIQGTTSRRRLIKFYRRFGFRPNQGRRHDCQVLDDMIREPGQSPPSKPSPRTPHPKSDLTSER
jgi:hypothetical protein